ncbi:response regulator [Pontibacter sp. 172403-2]|uniref:PAS domain-containing hybrid sensor histidine kinase/response regulator n=1 Tax=Pontibacter rufus TaxID=2791028 RepID=UPI0018AFF193|nr:response regulator [Pontibacter sp. 172403-2]MBF9255009.1 response regulator [Pontibacter sp. 172403-2]
MKVLQERIEEIITLIAEVANGNFDYEIDTSETGDELDAIISGISMLGQELKNSTVSRDFMQSIYRGVVDMLLILNPDFTVRNVNEAYEELLGYQEEELKGLHLSELVHEHDKPALMNLLENFQDKGKYLNVELSLSTKQEHSIPASCSFSYLMSNEKEVDGILVIAKDITEIKKKERELKDAKNKAEAASEAKSNFLSSMSHEIRTPLNGVMGFTGLLMETDLSESQAHYVHLIRTSGSTLTRLLNDILDLHRIESDKLFLEMIPFNIRESVLSNLEPYRQLAQSKNLSFTYSFSESLPAVVLGDPTRIGQMLINLVSNAIKFTEHGSVHVHLEAVGEQEEFKLKCTVTDTGIGIPEEKQAIIFDSFTQSDQSVTRNYGGSGLGLSISRKLASLMQGKLGVASPVPGQPNGSCFWFSVTLKSAQSQEGSSKNADIDTEFKLQKDTQILVVDDNALNVMLMEDVLGNLGATVTTAQSGKEAVETARLKSFDLVFMDIEMPNMNGLEAAMLLRNLNFSSPIIAFSANAYKDDIQKSIEAGMNDHLCKPFDSDELTDLLRKWI